MDLLLRDRVALVTGGSRGIGRAAAMLLAREGARVALTYHSARDSADAVVAEIGEANGTAIAVPMDLAVPESVADAAAAVLRRWGRIDILVNNAVRRGWRRVWELPAFEELPAAEWREFLRANIEGPFGAAQAVVPSMRAHGWGRIVSVTGTSAVDGMPGAGQLTTAKAALHGLTRTLARELGPAGILVNAVMPGTTLTERMAELLPEEFHRRRAESAPIRRLLRPEEVVPTVAFLCSGANTAVTGEIVRVSGGLAM